MKSGFSEGRIINSRRLADATMDEIADRIVNLRKPDSGLKYHRSKHPNKNQARIDAAALFSSRKWPSGLSILTMPGVAWSFERWLLGLREHGNRIIGVRRPRRTYIASIERNEGIYRAAMSVMPGLEYGLVELPAAPFASTTVRTRAIARFHRCRFEDLANHYIETRTHRFDAAWLDFSGTITAPLLALIATFWQTSIRWRLCITSFAARWPEGGHLEDFEERCLAALGGRLLHILHYQDTGGPMVQIGVEKPHGTD